MTNDTPFRVRFLDLSIADKEERKAYLDAIDVVMQHGRFINGPEIVELESAIAAFCKRKFAVGVGSGTDAILLALKALGIAAGDHIITSSISWLASATTIAQTGAIPVFADVNEDLNINLDSVRENLNHKTKAILAVDYAGKICQIEELRTIAEAQGIPLIEDASQAFGAFRNGAPAGANSDIAVFSLNPMKVLPAMGEAGIILTDDEALTERLKSLRYHGMIDRWRTATLSPNARMDTIQAAILLKRLEQVEHVISARTAIAEQYNRGLSSYVTIPQQTNSPETRDAWFVYPIQTTERDKLIKHLHNLGIEALLREHIALPDQPVFASYNSATTKNARRIADQLLCLPLYENLTEDDVNTVLEGVRSFFDGDAS